MQGIKRYANTLLMNFFSAEFLFGGYNPGLILVLGVDNGYEEIVHFLDI